MPNFSCPPDFQDHAPTQTNRHLADRYGVGEKMITRWRKETGCTAAIRPFTSSALPKAHVRAMTSGAVSEAAQFLRKTYRPVYNRAIEGKEFRGQYVVGTHVLSEDEVVALAEAKGLRAYSGERLLVASEASASKAYVTQPLPKAGSKVCGLPEDP